MNFGTAWLCIVARNEFWIKSMQLLINLLVLVKECIIFDPLKIETVAALTLKWSQ